jgi:hypothetical protein
LIFHWSSHFAKAEYSIRRSVATQSLGLGEYFLKKPYPNPPANTPPGTAWFGGPIAWFSVSLSIVGDDLNPVKITDLLGVQPDTAQRKGVRLPARGEKPGRLPSFGMWSICLRRDQTDEWDIEAAICALLDRIVVNNDVWKIAVDNAKARVFVGLSLDAGNRGFGFSPELLRRVADLGIQLDFDLYAEHPNDKQR